MITNTDLARQHLFSLAVEIPLPDAETFYNVSKITIVQIAEKALLCVPVNIGVLKMLKAAVQR